MTTPPKKSIWAAGGVLYRQDDDATRFLLVHRLRYADWSIPKGKLDRGEAFFDAARREIREETGIIPKGSRPLGTTGYRTPRGKDKVVRWWLFQPGKGSFVPNEEVAEAAWFTESEAAKRLTYLGERRVVRRAAALAEARRSGIVNLVRHAWAGDKKLWQKQDWLRPLDRQGLRQAQYLHLRLETVPLTRVLTSHYKRGVDSVRPLATAQGLPIEKNKGLGAKGDVDGVLAMLRDLEGESVAMCSHGKVIGDVIGKLAAEGIPMDGPMEWRKGSVWVLDTNKGRVTQGRYIPPV